MIEFLGLHKRTEVSTLDNLSTNGLIWVSLQLGKLITGTKECLGQPFSKAHSRRMILLLLKGLEWNKPHESRLLERLISQNEYSLDLQEHVYAVVTVGWGPTAHQIPWQPPDSLPSMSLTVLAVSAWAFVNDLQYQLRLPFFRKKDCHSYLFTHINWRGWLRTEKW